MIGRPEIVTIGTEKVSVTIFRKTENDLLISQLSLERWFATSDEAEHALRSAINVLLAPNGPTG